MTLLFVFILASVIRVVECDIDPVQTQQARRFAIAEPVRETDIFRPLRLPFGEPFATEQVRAL